MKFLHIGTDPEFFYVNKGEFKDFPEGVIIPPVIFRKENKLEVIRLIGDRHFVFYEEDGYLIHEDGAAFEMTTPPFTNIIEMRDNVIKKIREAEEKLGINFTISPAEKFYIPDIYKKDEDYLKACELGCNPDEEGYKPEINLTVRTITATELDYRFGGGHIMIEFPEEVKEFFIKWPNIFAQFMAINVGNILIANTQVPDKLKLRAEYYGTPSKFRRDKVDQNLFEFRTPSNEWLHFPNDVLLEMEKGINVSLNLFLRRDYLAKEFISRFMEITFRNVMEIRVEESKKLLREIKKYWEEV